MDTSIQTKRLDVEFDEDGIVIVTWRHPKTKSITGQTLATHIHKPVPDWKALATDRDLLQRAAEALEWYLSREKPTNIRRDICELLDAIEARLKEKA